MWMETAAFTKRLWKCHKTGNIAVDYENDQFYSYAVIGLKWWSLTWYLLCNLKLPYFSQYLISFLVYLKICLWIRAAYNSKNVITAPFSNMWTLKFKTQLTNAFFAIVIKCLVAPPSFWLLPSTVSLSELCSTICDTGF